MQKKDPQSKKSIFISDILTTSIVTSDLLEWKEIMTINDFYLVGQYLQWKTWETQLWHDYW